MSAHRLARLTLAGVLGGVIVSAMVYTVAAVVAGAYVALLAAVAVVAAGVVPFGIVYAGNTERS